MSIEQRRHAHQPGGGPWLSPVHVRVRVAPSPTGDPHVGTAYMSLFNLAFARQQGGEFILRIEDTDRARYVADSEQQVFDTLRWLGLDWDEGPDKGGPYAPYRQSERSESYRRARRPAARRRPRLPLLVLHRAAGRDARGPAAGEAPTGYDRLCVGKTREERAALPGFSESPVVRMLIPDDAPLAFDDVIRGQVKAPRPDDQVIVKADGFPTYHLANVVDDHEMAITHVVRGEEWISSTPKHVLLYDWLGWERPSFAHMPLLRNVDKSKISKRKNPAARLTWFLEQGYLPEALRNFLALMGYSQPDGAEIFTFDDMVRDFDWQRVNTVGPVFDLDKLGWLNGHYLRELSVDDLAARIAEHLVAGGCCRRSRPRAARPRARGHAAGAGADAGALRGRGDARLPAGRRRRLRGRPCRRHQGADARGATGPGGERRGARRPADLGDRRHRGGAARGSRRGPRAQAQAGLRSGAGGDDRSPGVAAAVRVARAAGPDRTLSRLRAAVDAA